MLQILALNMNNSCNKGQNVMRKLLPGSMLIWCEKCRLCVCMHIMSNAESPKTVFDTLYTRWQHAPARFCYDNGCNLNREPAFFRNTKFLIDQSHYQGHKQCSLCYNTGELQAVTPSA